MRLDENGRWVSDDGAYVWDDAAQTWRLANATSPSAMPATGSGRTASGQTGSGHTGSGQAGPGQAGSGQTSSGQAGWTPPHTGPLALSSGGSAGTGATGPIYTGQAYAGPADTGSSYDGRPGPGYPDPARSDPAWTGSVRAGQAPAARESGRPTTTGPFSTGPSPAGQLQTGQLQTGPMPTGPMATGPMATGPIPTGPMPTARTVTGASGGRADSAVAPSDPAENTTGIPRRMTRSRPAGQLAVADTDLDDADPDDTDLDGPHLDDADPDRWAGDDDEAGLRGRGARPGDGHGPEGGGARRFVSGLRASALDPRARWGAAGPGGTSDNGGGPDGYPAAGDPARGIAAMLRRPTVLAVATAFALVVALGVAGFLVLGGGDDSGSTASASSAGVGRYDAAVRKDYIDACLGVSDGNERYCTCTLEKLEADYTQEQYLAFNSDVESDNSQRIVREIYAACRNLR